GPKIASLHRHLPQRPLGRIYCHGQHGSNPNPIRVHLWLRLTPKHGCEVVLINLLPLWRLGELQAQDRVGLENRHLHSVLFKRLLPARNATRHLDVVLRKLIAIHVDAAIDVNRVRRQRPDQITTPDVWIRNRVSRDLVLFHISNCVYRNIQLLLHRWRVDLRLQLESASHDGNQQHEVENNRPATVAGRRGLRRPKDLREAGRLHPSLQVLSKQRCGDEGKDVHVPARFQHRIQRTEKQQYFTRARSFGRERQHGHGPKNQGSKRQKLLLMKVRREPVDHHVLLHW